MLALLYFMAAFQGFAASGLFAILGENSLLDVLLLILLYLSLKNPTPQVTCALLNAIPGSLSGCGSRHCRRPFPRLVFSFPHAHVWLLFDVWEEATTAVVRRVRDVHDRVHLISRV